MMLTQLATQVELASQTVDYTNDFSALLIGLMLLVGMSAGMIILEILRPQFLPVFKLALEIRRLQQTQAHAA